MDRGFSCWVGLMIGIYCMMIAGFQYSFSSWSSSLKDTFSYTNAETNTVGTLLNAGSWAGIIGAIVMDNYGARATCITGSVVCTAGLGALCYLFRFSHNSPMIVVGLVAFVCGNGVSFAYSAALKTCILNFGADIRGRIVATLVCFFGLSGGNISIMQ